MLYHHVKRSWKNNEKYICISMLKTTCKCKSCSFHDSYSQIYQVMTNNLGYRFIGIFMHFDEVERNLWWVASFGRCVKNVTSFRTNLSDCEITRGRPWPMHMHHQIGHILYARPSLDWLGNMEQFTFVVSNTYLFVLLK